LSSPGYFGHGPKEASHAGRRLDLGQTSRDLAVKCQLLELGEGQVAEAVMPAHEFGLVVNCGQVDMLVFLKLRIDVEGKRSHPCGFLLFLVSFP
jgi:hypothetical protein